MIADHAVSVVVQGPFDPVATPRVIADVRRLMPNAEIILSSWAGTTVPGNLAIDRVLLNPDPGVDAVRRRDGGPRNGNRQIVATCAGLKAATRPYALKLRSDTTLDHAGILARWQPDLIALLPSMVPAITPFFPADFTQFGRREDVLTLWDIPLFDARRDARRFRFGHEFEQYWCLSFLGRAVPDAMTTVDKSDAIIAAWSAILAQRFQLIEPADFGIRFLKPTLVAENAGTTRPFSQLWFRKAGPATWRDWRRQAGLVAAPDDAATVALMGLKSRLLLTGDAVGLFKIDRQGLLAVLAERYRAGDFAAVREGAFTLAGLGMMSVPEVLAAIGRRLPR